MTAGIQHESPTQAPTLNVEQLIRKKVMVVKLTSGEYLIAAVFQTMDMGLNLTHPYEIVTRTMQLNEKWLEVPVLEPHCPYVTNRTFFIPWSSIIYAKEATENFSNLYLEEFSRCEGNDYSRLLMTFQTAIQLNQEKKVISMIADSTVVINGDKILVTGNETQH
jgi:hypothetical protein